MIPQSQIAFLIVSSVIKGETVQEKWLQIQGLSTKFNEIQCIHFGIWSTEWPGAKESAEHLGFIDILIEFTCRAQACISSEIRHLPRKVEQHSSLMLTHRQQLMAGDNEKQTCFEACGCAWCMSRKVVWVLPSSLKVEHEYQLWTVGSFTHSAQIIQTVFSPFYSWNWGPLLDFFFFI